jgi:outer membrane PBP1 activator LpoA protein
LNRLVRLVDPARHDAVFFALDAQEAALVRALIPRQILVFGTSLLNLGGPAGTPAAIALSRDLDAVRFVDAPWLLAPGAPSTAALPAPAVPLSADLARLYALGADAYRLAMRWSAGEARFTLDGATGRLRVDRSAGPRVERTPALAIFRNGAIERDEVRR